LKNTEITAFQKTGNREFSISRFADVLVFKVADKMFTATDVNTFGSFSVKHDPDKIDELRSK